jgi:abortive infection bacteriophage resistance protein
MPKIFLNYNQQIDKLKNEKNLQIDDTLYAKEILKQTSYYSLIGGYKDIFKNPTTKKYKDGTKFEDVVELYYFDESLRQLFLKYLIKVENEIKSQLSYYFTEKYGENQNEYLNKTNYNYVGRKNQRDIDHLIKILEGYVIKPTDYRYINHSQRKYGNVPLWVLTNALTFGNISKMYMLITQDLQIKISKSYPYINERQLISLLTVLVKFRNVCAHGERLFTYKTFDSIPDLPIHSKLSIKQKGSQYIYGKNDLFSVVIALRYLLSDNWYKEFIKELKTLIDKYLKKHESISEYDLYSKMGFPENWRKITRYRKK